MAAAERGRTVFVRNVSYDVDDSALEEAFNDVGPVRQAFLVKEKGQPRHKGFGYVQFAIAEDAERAVAELHGRALAGRSIKVEIAAKRAPFQERKAKRRRGDGEDEEADGEDEGAAAGEEAAEEAEAPPTPVAAPKRARKQAADGAAAGEKHNLIRTIALGNLTPETAPAAIAAARAAGGFESATDPAPPGDVSRAHLTADGCSGHVVFVQYATVKDANAAVAKLHGRPLSQLAAGGAAGGKKGRGKKGDGTAGGAEGEGQLWARVVTGEGAHIKKWRIILRNLPFQATEADVRRILAPAGFVWSVDIPRGADGRTRGFAFAAFTNPQDAGKGIAVANGVELRKRQVAADWAVAKKQYQDGDGGAATAELAAAAAGAEKEGGSDEEEGSGGSSEAEGSEEEAGLSNEEEEEGSEGGSSEEEEEEGSEEDPDLAHEHGMVHGVLDQLLASEVAAAASDAKAMGKGKKKEAAAAGDQQQQKKQEPKKQQWEGERAGAAAEGGTGAAGKGGAIGCTVFVRGLALDTTSQELQARLERFGPVKACRMVMNKSTGTPKGTAFIEFRTPAGAAAAAEACARARAGKGPEVQLRGRAMEIDAALDKEGAKTLAIAQAAAKGAAGAGADRRNLYLAREGHIEEGSAAWQGMSEYDRSKRKRSAEEKNAKLKSPNFAVSPLRLSVRNIPASWDEARLKKLFVGAVKERATKENPAVKQAKILRDSDRPDPSGDPRGRSKGIGFVEFDRHDHALAALRQLNNNPAPFGGERRPIVEFAIENVKVLKMREDREAKQKARRAQEGEGAAAGGKKKGRVERRQARKQQQREQQQQQNGGGEAVAANGPGKKQQQRQKPQQNGGQQQQQNGTRQQQQKQQHGQNAKQQGKVPAPGSKAARAAAAAAASAKAAEASATARAAKAVQQQRREAGAAQRKRRADDALDRLATAADDGAAAGSNKGKRRRGGADRAAENKLEGLVADFKARMFGGGAGGGGGAGAGKGGPGGKGSGGGGDAGGAIRRWFE